LTEAENLKGTDKGKNEIIERIHICHCELVRRAKLHVWAYLVTVATVEDP
jgi:hypothetical protein